MNSMKYQGVKISKFGGLFIFFSVHKILFAHQETLQAKPCKEITSEVILKFITYSGYIMAKFVVMVAPQSPPWA